VQDQNEMKGYLFDALARYDRNYDTFNNWSSMYVHGVIIHRVFYIGYLTEIMIF